MTAGIPVVIRRFLGPSRTIVVLAALAGLTEGSADGSWPPGAPFPSPPDSARLAGLEATHAALDTLDEARWDFVAAMLEGSLDRLRATSDARERAADRLSRSVVEESILSSLAWPERRRWLELALSERRRDWLRPLLRTASADLPPPGDPERGPAALAVGIAALRLLEADPEEDSAFLEADPDRSLDALAVRALRAAAAEPVLLRDEAMYRLAIRADAEGDTATALAWADSIALHAPESCRAPAARAIRARSWLAAGRQAVAEEEARRGLDREPLLELRVLVAEAALAQGRGAEAARELEAVILASPADRLAASAYRRRLDLGRIDTTLTLEGAGRIPLLLALLANPAANAEADLVALSEDPGVLPAARVEASLGLAKHQYRRKRYEPAEARFRSLLDAADPAAAGEARLYLARIYRNLGNLEPMTRAYRTLLEADGEHSPVAAWELGREWESLARWNEAETAYTELLRKHPADSRRRDATFRRGFARLRAGNGQAALVDFRECARLSTTPAEEEQAAFWLARTLTALGRDSEARSVAAGAAKDSWPAEAYGVLIREEIASPSQDRAGPSIPGVSWTDAAPGGLPALEPWKRVLDRGTAFLRLGDPDAARAEFRTPAASPGPAVHERLATVAAAYGLYPEGVLWANRALRAVSSRDPQSWPLRRLAYPAAHAGYVVPAARRTGLDPALVWALMRQESMYDARAVSRAGAIGLMQLMPATLARMNAALGEPPLSPEILFHPGVNIAYGTRFLADRLAEFQGKLYPTLAGYNAGERKSREWLGRSDGDADEVFLECIGYVETYSYVRRIIWLRWMYHTLYQEDDGVSSPDE